MFTVKSDEINPKPPQNNVNSIQKTDINQNYSALQKPINVDKTDINSPKIQTQNSGINQNSIKIRNQKTGVNPNFSNVQKAETGVNSAKIQSQKADNFGVNSANTSAENAEIDSNSTKNPTKKVGFFSKMWAKSWSRSSQSV
jgi:hypothetical protein